MGLIEKLEILLNGLLFKLGELLWKVMPLPVKKFADKWQAWKLIVHDFVKTLPSLLKILFFKILATVKSIATSIDYKAIFVDSYKSAMARYNGAKLGGLKKLILTPVLVFAQWLQGLTPGQSLMLVTFTCASILAVIGIGFSGQKLLNQGKDAGRTPASAEEISYDRPGYYKKHTKHFTMTNFRLPVYIPELNEIRSVDVDFTATLSNRHARMFLEKWEFQLRDHLILQIEPSISSFPLEEEGKVIIKKKIWAEINDFLKLHEIDGEVTELKITYALAN